MHQQQYFCICGYGDRQIELPSGPFAGKKPKVFIKLCFGRFHCADGCGSVFQQGVDSQRRPGSGLRISYRVSIETRDLETFQSIKEYRVSNVQYRGSSILKNCDVICLFLTKIPNKRRSFLRPKYRIVTRKKAKYRIDIISNEKKRIAQGCPG